jgi:hypothetical protein
MYNWLSLFEGKAVDSVTLGALIGAFVGGLMTYWATAKFSKVQQRKLELSICSVILIEVTEHQASLAVDLDRTLPVYLGRHFNNKNADSYIREITAFMPQLRDRVYDQFFATVVTTSIGVSLMTYYSRIKWHNEIASKYREGISGDMVQKYVLLLAVLIELGVDIIQRIRAMKGISPWLTSKEHELIFSGFDSQKERFLYMAALSRVSSSQLQDLERSEPVLSLGFPDIIRKDSTQLWKVWYKAANKLHF